MSTQSTQSLPAAPEPLRLLPVQEFCRQYSMSKASFFRHQARGTGPAVVKVGRRTLVPAQAAASWLAGLCAQDAGAGA